MRTCFTRSDRMSAGVDSTAPDTAAAARWCDWQSSGALERADVEDDPDAGDDGVGRSWARAESPGHRPADWPRRRRTSASNRS